MEDHKKQKIIFVDQALGAGGAERVLCTLMRSLDKSLFDIECIIITGDGPLSYLIPDYVTVKKLHIRNTRKALPGVIRVLRNAKPDTVFCSSPRIAVLLVMARLMVNNFRLISRYPSMPSIEIQTGAVNGWRLFLTKIVFRYVNLVIAQTEEMAHELADIYHIDTNKLLVVHNPVDKIYIDQCLENTTNPFSRDNINVVVVGTTYPVKGHDVLIKAFHKVKAMYPGAVLHIIGRDRENYLSTLQDYVKELQLIDSVVFWGHQTNPYRFMQYADLLVLPSRREGLPNVLLEANYIGCKCVATDCVPVIRRLLRNDYVVPVESVEALCNAIVLALSKEGNGTETNLDVDLSNDSLVKIFDLE
ncbi:N-acetylgalactosamine-N,N'-diacetylbacillosaminyl-diphospho-undecaprenol 4-alpha-N-acetylgalactosaminyltransferase [Rubritalea halochordaticola]|uniref:N-acetylgalactosamine-N, N'-diacetylbacillosaminyl-diphospho-undecaprenol 4-alpha-N-acetylgalactosaminyltransferase n=1 Tax=Rubritalea halochordaticola TaxID=714537 RepID=A0ABP9UXM8_9BACT